MALLDHKSYRSLVLQLHKNRAEILEMSKQSCICGRCETPVPSELESVGRCVTHFISGVEQMCAQMHREIVLRGTDVERQAAVATYIRESAQLLAQVSSNLRLTDELKRRILCSFLCLMNLREKLDRVRGVRPEGRPSAGSPETARSAVAAG